MEVKNEKKVMFKDMLPIEMHAIVTAGNDGIQWYSEQNISGWHDYGKDCFGNSCLADHEGFFEYFIYRTKPPKPKTITPNELYDMVESAYVMGQTLKFENLIKMDDALNLIKQLQGFKDE